MFYKNQPGALWKASPLMENVTLNVSRPILPNENRTRWFDRMSERHLAEKRPEAYLVSWLERNPIQGGFFTMTQRNQIASAERFKPPMLIR